MRSLRPRRWDGRKLMDGMVVMSEAPDVGLASSGRRQLHAAQRLAVTALAAIPSTN